MEIDYKTVISNLELCGFEVTRINGLGEIRVCNPISGHEFVFSNVPELNAFVLGLQQNGDVQ